MPWRVFQRNPAATGPQTPPLPCGKRLCYTRSDIRERGDGGPMGLYPTSFDKDDLLKCARGELFGPGNAQLPAPPMLMMDRITDISEDRGEHGKGHGVARFDITLDLWLLEFHFPCTPFRPA